MCKLDLENDNSRRTLRIFIVVAILIFVFIAYGSNGVRNNSYNRFLPLSTKLYTNFANIQGTSDEINATTGLNSTTITDDEKYNYIDVKPINKTATYDIMSMKSIIFDKAFKNPCWRGEGITGPFTDGELHCLPYFHLIGVKKSGTTYFMSRLNLHPEFCAPSLKESQWFARVRFGDIPFKNGFATEIMQKGYDLRKVDFFSAMLDKASTCISTSPLVNGDNSTYYRRITADASPSDFHMHTNWELWPGNENLSEPRYTNFHYIKRITPDAKIIILFRDPVPRLYSDFMFTNYATSRRWLPSSHTPEVFHQQVLTLIKAYTNCFSYSTVRSCVYNSTLRRQMAQKGIAISESFSAGFYAVFMRDLLSVFENAQLLPLCMSDYVTKMEETLRNVFSFLDMSPVSVKKMQKILYLPKQHVTKRETKPMFNETRDLLHQFYKPFNMEMAALMDDSRYMFSMT